MKSLLGKIFLTKTSFFGLDKQRVVLFVSPSMKLYKIISSPQSLKNKVPFEENKIISTEQIKQWAENNNFQISFDATIPNLRNRLFTEFGDVNLLDPDLYENIADLICEKKKLSKTKIYPIVKNIKRNVKLIDLRMENLPQEIVEKMENELVANESRR